MCNHERFKCVNNRFICLLCGQEIPNPYTAKAEKEPAPEAQKKPAKRRAKKEAE